MVYDFHCPVPDVVHPLHPQHLILCFELFGRTLTKVPCVLSSRGDTSKTKLYSIALAAMMA